MGKNKSAPKIGVTVPGGAVLMPGDVKVPWVVGRQRAVARAVAIHVAATSGRDWARMTVAQRDAAVRDAVKVVDQWVRDGVLASFLYPYREAE